VSELDEMREKIAKLMAFQDWDSGLIGERDWEKLMEEDKAQYMNDANQILSLETDTCWIAVVRKEPELPKNPYPLVNGVRYDLAQDDGDIPTVIDGSCYRGYDIAQQDMLKQGWVKEVDKQEYRVSEQLNREIEVTLCQLVNDTIHILQMQGLAGEDAGEFTSIPKQYIDQIRQAIEAMLKEETIILREISREEAKDEILQLFLKGETLYFSDIAKQLRLDLELVVDICRELIMEGDIDE
jgi:hypothetical protein